jgi:hypothetical protein
LGKSVIKGRECLRDFYHSKKKKIRGWKRHKRKIELWKQNAINLDIDLIRKHHRDYVKLWIYPFYFRLFNPPGWYSRLLLEAMIEVYLKWYERMIEENNEFYLKIWLYEPNFIKSQIVVAYKDCLNFYDKTFEKRSICKKFPSHKYAFLAGQLEMFDWKLCIEADVYWSTDLEEDVKLGFRSEQEASKIISQSYRIDEIDNDEKKTYAYCVDVGDVWVGTLKISK